jgi:preprotein translocase subunit YajC
MALRAWGIWGEPLLAQGGGGGLGDALFGSMLIPLLLTMLLMYVLLMRPEQKKRKELERMLAGLKKNDHVVTIGGIFGTVVAASPDSKVVTIRIDDSTGTKIKILRSAISHISSPEEVEETSKTSA